MEFLDKEAERRRKKHIANKAFDDIALETPPIPSQHTPFTVYCPLCIKNHDWNICDRGSFSVRKLQEGTTFVREGFDDPTSDRPKMTMNEREARRRRMNRFKQSEYIIKKNEEIE